MKKKSNFLLLSFCIFQFTFSQNVIFLHHSTGGGVYNAGVEAWISNYNSTNQTNYQITERSYPNDPYPWNNYPYDFWNLWVNNQCNSDDSDIECLNTLTQNFNVIIFKHCFPGADIGEDTGSPDVSSESKSLENYKLQYRALRSKMDEFPNNKFIVWTLAPLHRNATNTVAAGRAKEFVNWVKNDWLTEDANEHPNIYIFDFWGYAAESNSDPEFGEVNCLKYDYEGNHDGDDSHPNSTANNYIAPVFAEFIVNTIKNNNSGTTVIKKIKKNSLELFYNSAGKMFTTNISDNQYNKAVYLDAFDITGAKVFQGIIFRGQVETELRNGVYIIQLRTDDNILLTKKIFVN